MPATKLSTISVNKPWGRHTLWPGFEAVPADGEPVGEIWYQVAQGRPEPELLVKYLFTSERLSIQVHPGDDDARAAGYRQGKDEAWLILAAEPGATIALGTRYPVSRAELRAAALDGVCQAQSLRRVRRRGSARPRPCLGGSLPRAHHRHPDAPELTAVPT